MFYMLVNKKLYFLSSFVFLLTKLECNEVRLIPPRVGSTRRRMFTENYSKTRRPTMLRADHNASEAYLLAVRQMRNDEDILADPSRAPGNDLPDTLTSDAKATQLEGTKNTKVSNDSLPIALANRTKGVRRSSMDTINAGIPFF